MSHRNFNAIQAHNKGSATYSQNRSKAWGSKAVIGMAAVGCGVVAWYSIFTSSDDVEDHLLHERKFKPFQIMRNEPVSSTCSIITLRASTQQPAPKIDDPAQDQWSHSLWSVEFKQPLLQIARAYTPLPPTETMQTNELRFLIRREHRGEMSNYISNLKVGEIIGVRGPRVEYEIPDNVKDVVFLAGGTSIAPALQTAHILLRGKAATVGSTTRVHILWANRKREEVAGGKSPHGPGGFWRFWRSNTQAVSSQVPNVLIEELNSLEAQFPGRFTFQCLVDEEGSFITDSLIKQACGDRRNQVITPESKLVVVSGPDGFVQHFAGPKEIRNGQEVQGRLGGVLFRCKPSGWGVVKL